VCWARGEGSSLTRAPAGQGAVPSMEEGRQQNAGYLSASAAAERLQRNVQREHSLCTDFLLAFWQARAPGHPTILYPTLTACSPSGRRGPRRARFARPCAPRGAGARPPGPGAASRLRRLHSVLT